MLSILIFTPPRFPNTPGSEVIWPDYTVSTADYTPVGFMFQQADGGWIVELIGFNKRTLPPLSDEEAKDAFRQIWLDPGEPVPYEIVDMRKRK